MDKILKVSIYFINQCLIVGKGLICGIRVKLVINKAVEHQPSEQLAKTQSHLTYKIIQEAKRQKKNAYIKVRKIIYSCLAHRGWALVAVSERSDAKRRR